MYLLIDIEDKLNLDFIYSLLYNSFLLKLDKDFKWKENEFRNLVELLK